MARRSFISLATLFFAVAVQGISVGPEVSSAPPRLGVPPTWDDVTHVIPNAQGFLVTFVSDGHALTQQLGSTGKPSTDRPSPSQIPDTFPSDPAGFSLATDGHRILASERVFVRMVGDVFTYVLHVELFDETSSKTLATAAIDEDVIAVGPVLWTGHDYIVSYLNRANTLRIIRISAAGLLTYGPVDVASDVGFLPVAAFDGYDAVFAAKVCSTPACDHLRIIRVTPQNDVRIVEEIQASNPDYMQAVSAGESVFLLVFESTAGGGSWNIYRIHPYAGVQLIESLAEGANMVSTGDQVVLYRVQGSQIVAKVVTAPKWVPVLDLRTRDASGSPIVAASQNGVIVFGWSESLISTVQSTDPVFATIDATLANSRADGVPDGMLLAHGASYRSQPVVAVANGTTLIAWLETIEGQSWIAGSLIGADGSTKPIAISAPDANGAPRIASDGSDFFVAWTVAASTYSAIRARIVRPDGTMSEVRQITSDHSANPVLAWNAGSYAMVWEDPAELLTGYSLFGTQVLAQRFDRSALPIDAAPRLIAGPTSSKPAIASDGSRLLVVWTNGSSCTKALCLTDTNLDVYGRVLDAQLSPISPVVGIGVDPHADETHAVTASSGTGWLVGWTAKKRVMRGLEPLLFSDVGYAAVSPDGHVITAYQPPLTTEGAPLREVGGITWTGTTYVLASVADDIRLMSIGSTGYLYAEAVVQAAAASADIGSSADRTVLAYARPAPEQQIGAAPQVFLRNIVTQPPSRRRAAIR